MFKKVFALSLISASLVVAGCSSDDDDDDDPVLEVTPGIGGSAYDLLYNDSENYSTILSLIEANGLAGTLDNGTYTIFAPTNAALAGADASTVTAALLTKHVIEGAVSSSAVTDGLVATSLQGEELAFALDVDGNLTVDGVMISNPDAHTGEMGVVHGIAGVLSVTETGTNPDPDLGEFATVVSNAAGTLYADSLAVFLNKFNSGTFENPDNAWTVFLPSQVGEITADQMVGVVTLTPETLAAMSEVSSYDNSATYAVGGTAEALTLGGLATTVLATRADGNFIVYGVDGNLASMNIAGQ